jgi:hypothetical protein
MTTVVEQEVRFECGGCGAAHKVPARAAGRSGRCPRCKTRMRVPAPPEPVVIEYAPQRDPVRYVLTIGPETLRYVEVRPEGGGRDEQHPLGSVVRVERAYGGGLDLTVAGRPGPMYLFLGDAPATRAFEHLRAITGLAASVRKATPGEVALVPAVLAVFGVVFYGLLALFAALTGGVRMPQGVSIPVKGADAVAFILANGNPTPMLVLVALCVLGAASFSGVRLLFRPRVPVLSASAG